MSDLRERLAEKIKGPQLINFATVTPEGRPWVRYVMAAGTPDLKLMFATFVGSRKVAHVENNPEVHVTLGATDPAAADTYVQLEGTAEISREEGLKNALWNPNLEQYFNGPDDPNYCVCVVTPRRLELMGMTGMTPEVYEVE
jgi:general stress protein 26